jgi:hypothetical protein
MLMLAMVECLGLDGGGRCRDATSCGRVKEPGFESIRSIRTQSTGLNKSYGLKARR